MFLPESERQIGLRTPSTINRVLEKLRLRQVGPEDICLTREDLDLLYTIFPDLAGDGTTIGRGDDGKCQSWQDDWGWWRRVVPRKT